MVPTLRMALPPRVTMIPALPYFRAWLLEIVPPLKINVLSSNTETAAPELEPPAGLIFSVIMPPFMTQVPPGTLVPILTALVALFFTIAFCSGIGTVGGAEAMSAVGTQESGTASALMGMSMFVFGGIAAPLSGIGGETLLKMSLAITVCYTLALLVALTRIDNQK